MYPVYLTERIFQYALTLRGPVDLRKVQEDLEPFVNIQWCPWTPKGHNI